MRRSYIGKHIREARKAKNITQKELAVLIGKAESSIQKYEAGKTEIPINVLEDIANTLDTDFFKLTAMNFDDLKEKIHKQMDDEMIGMLVAAGFNTTELENGEFEVVGKYGPIIITRKEFDTLYTNLIDYISYTTEKFYQSKRDEKFQ